MIGPLGFVLLLLGVWVRGRFYFFWVVFRCVMRRHAGELGSDLPQNGIFSQDSTADLAELTNSRHNRGLPKTLCGVLGVIWVVLGPSRTKRLIETFT